jgi:hypothetical protein
LAEIMLSVAFLIVVLNAIHYLNVIMPNAIMLHVIMLSVIMYNVNILNVHTEFHYADVNILNVMHTECHYAKCRDADVGSYYLFITKCLRNDCNS